MCGDLEEDLQKRGYNYELYPFVYAAIDTHRVSCAVILYNVKSAQWWWFVHWRASARLFLHCPLLSVMSYTATWQLWKHGRTYPLLDGTTPRRSLLLFTASPTAMPTEVPAPPPAAAARQLPSMVQGRPRAAHTGAATPGVKATVAPTPAKVSVHAATVHASLQVMYFVTCSSWMQAHQVLGAKEILF